MRRHLVLLPTFIGLLGCAKPDKVNVTVVYAGDGDLSSTGTAKLEVSLFPEDPNQPAFVQASFSLGSTGSLSGTIPYGANVHAIVRGLSPDGDVVAMGGSRSYAAPEQGTPFELSLFVAPTNSFYATQDIDSGAATGPETGLPGLTATRLSDGQVLIAGGAEVDGEGNILDLADVAYVFDPDTGKYRRLSATLNNKRAFHTATALRGRPSSILLCGGITIVNSQLVSAQTCDLFDPTTETFSVVEMKAPRFGHAAVLLPDTRVLVTGGADIAKVSLPCTSCSRDDLSLSLVLDSVELYDPEAQRFTTLPNGMAWARAFHTALRANKNGRVLVVGGENDAGDTLASTEIFTPGTDTFLSGPDLESARTRHAAARLPNDNVCVYGGLGDTTAPSSVLSTYECFEVSDFAGATKAPTQSMFAPRRDPCAVALASGTVVLIGGLDPASDALASAELDDPALEAVSAGAPVAGRAYHACAAIGVGGTNTWEGIFVVGGIDVRSGVVTGQPTGEIYTP